MISAWQKSWMLNHYGSKNWQEIIPARKMMTSPAHFLSGTSDSGRIRCMGRNSIPSGRILDYIGNNIFLSPGQPAAMSSIWLFEISDTGSIKCIHTIINEKGNKHVYTFVKNG